MKNYYDFEEYELYYKTRDPIADRVIFHSDLNNFFASVEALFDPSLKQVPLAVCGDAEARHGIVLAKNELAKRYDVKTGDTIKEAQRKCPYIVIRPTRYGEYVKYSRMVREIYLSYATRIESFGIDEAWIDVSELAKRRGGDVFVSGKAIAEELRNKVKEEIGLTVSIGVSFNKTFSKLASDMKKPDAVTLISYTDFKNIIWDMPVGQLLFVGKRTREALERLKIEKIGDVARQGRLIMKNEFGKFGEALWDRANGYDFSPVAYYHSDDSTKSISNSTTTPYDLTTVEEVCAVLTPLAEEVTEQLRSRRINASTVRIYIKYADFSSFVRQTKLLPTDSMEEIFQSAVELFMKNSDLSIPIRSVGIGVEDFTDVINEQQDIFRVPTALDGAIDGLRQRYGDSVIKRASVMKNNRITDFNKKHVAFNSNI